MSLFAQLARGYRKRNGWEKYLPSFFFHLPNLDQTKKTQSVSIILPSLPLFIILRSKEQQQFAFLIEISIHPDWPQSRRAFDAQLFSVSLSNAPVNRVLKLSFFPSSAHFFKKKKLFCCTFSSRTCSVLGPLQSSLSYGLFANERPS